jgi:hypothetical protein
VGELNPRLHKLVIWTAALWLCLQAVELLASIPQGARFNDAVLQGSETPSYEELFRDAQTEFSQAIEAELKNAAPLMFRAWMLLTSGQVDAALGACDQAMRAEGKQKGALVVKGSIHAALGQ